MYIYAIFSQKPNNQSYLSEEMYCYVPRNTKNTAVFNKKTTEVQQN